jgi:hypothetical protein
VVESPFQSSLADSSEFHTGITLGIRGGLCSFSLGSGAFVQDVADWRDGLGRRAGQITETDSGRWTL